MPLFQNSVLKKYLSHLDPAAVKSEIVVCFIQAKVNIQALQAEISRLDREIDALVYGLNDLTELEIRIVEGNA